MKVVRSLRSRRFDVQHAVEAGMRGRLDIEQLKFASAQGRALVTHDRLDFERLHAEYLAEGREHNGIIIAKRRRDIEEVIRRLLRILDSVTQEEMALQLRYI